MRVTIMIGTLAALVAAAPWPREDASDDPSEEPTTISLPFLSPTVEIPLTTSLNVPVTSSLWELPTLTWSKRPHWEPIPIFTKECKCDIATVNYPCWATDALQRCNYEENFSYGCYMAAAGGCPTPTRACKNLFQPTPRPGKHPCDFGGPPSLVTPAPQVPSLITIPVLPTMSITLPVLPTNNVSLPVEPTTNVSLPVGPALNVVPLH
ncbi:hypothetical protein BDU57DRAFT_165295 [Ampelomyces quisqualis]|uniref:Extracellular membrane protein CFEM domain-containing protein n=1 Tax=Ampelomyces quisqualis TaxID=50730 RepID=A0A6A5QPZ5_AMPQU|nr:hypothetical protein BDU57DRAFT_165295 [Ampelomyces quisqualis]